MEGAGRGWGSGSSVGHLEGPQAIPPVEHLAVEQGDRDAQADVGTAQTTFDTASQWGFNDRGLLRVGLAGDVAIFDPKTISPNLPEIVHDLPAGAKRFKQTAKGFLFEVMIENPESWNAVKSALVRSCTSLVLSGGIGAACMFDALHTVLDGHRKAFRYRELSALVDAAETALALPV